MSEMGRSTMGAKISYGACSELGTSVCLVCTCPFRFIMPASGVPEPTPAHLIDNPLVGGAWYRAHSRMSDAAKLLFPHAYTVDVSVNSTCGVFLAYISRLPRCLLPLTPFYMRKRDWTGLTRTTLLPHSFNSWPAYSNCVSLDVQIRVEKLSIRDYFPSYLRLQYTQYHPFNPFCQICTCSTH